MDRATKGGEFGRNGEWYNGGQFLPNTDLGKRGSDGGKGNRKSEIAPYEWAVAPEDGMIAIWGIIRGYVHNIGGGYWPAYNRPEWKQLGPTNTEKVKGLIKQWLKGERWITTAESIREEPDDNYSHQTGWKAGTGPETW